LLDDLLVTDRSSRSLTCSTFRAVISSPVFYFSFGVALDRQQLVRIRFRRVAVAASADHNGISTPAPAPAAVAFRKWRRL